MSNLHSYNPYHSHSHQPPTSSSASGSRVAPTASATFTPGTGANDGFGWVDAAAEDVGGGPVRVIMTGLPVDQVSDHDVFDLFSHTISSTISAHMLYSQEGLSLGIALVTLGRASDAKRAFLSFNDKSIDGDNKVQIHYLINPSPNSPIPPTILNHIFPAHSRSALPAPPASAPANTAAPTSRVPTLYERMPAVERERGEVEALMQMQMGGRLGMGVGMGLGAGEAGPSSGSGSGSTQVAGTGVQRSLGLGGQVKKTVNKPYSKPATPTGPSNSKANGNNVNNAAINGHGIGSGKAKNETPGVKKSLLQRIEVPLKDRIAARSGSGSPAGSPVMKAGTPQLTRKLSSPAAQNLNSRLGSNPALLAKATAYNKPQTQQQQHQQRPAQQQQNQSRPAFQPKQPPAAAMPIAQGVNNAQKPAAAVVAGVGAGPSAPKGKRQPTEQELDEELARIRRQKKFGTGAGAEAMDTS